MGLSFQEVQSSDLMTPLEWRDWTKPIVARDSGPRFLDGAIVQAWAGSAVRMSQPPLDHHLIVLHQGGPKRVSRRQGREVRSVNVAMHACTTVEAGNTYEWTTEGPIAFAHIYIRPERFARVIGDVYGRDPDSVGFGERIGQFDPLAAQLAIALAQEREDAPAWRMTADHYLDSLLIRLAATTTYGIDGAPPRRALTPVTVRRVRDYVLAHLADPISLDDLASIAGYSRFHFVRAFREATGYPPYSYVINQRIAHAQLLLTTTDDPVAVIAHACGFATHAQFSKKFRDVIGLSPACFRRANGWS